MQTWAMTPKSLETIAEHLMRTDMLLYDDMTPK